MLSEALRLIRIYHDMKQRELANRLSISSSYLSEIESGKKMPTMEIIMKYSKEFKIPASSILFFSENINNSTGVGRMRNAIAGNIVRFLEIIKKDDFEKR